ncbi:hypothetical protein [Streptomyces lydicus]|uniref:hypothetical protein n=1 Tax=Streptomyces lydicus TaxID=47763 RepID=UPI0036E9512C
MEFTDEFVIVTDEGNRSVFEILPQCPPNPRYVSFILDAAGGRLWGMGWCQVLPDTMEAYAWEINRDRPEGQATPAKGYDTKGDERVV